MSKVVPQKIMADQAMAMTNDEFFSATMYFTDQVKVRVEDKQKFVNEFMIVDNIGHGSFSKVKRVIRVQPDSKKQRPQTST